MEGNKPDSDEENGAGPHVQNSLDFDGKGRFECEETDEMEHLLLQYYTENYLSKQTSTVLRMQRWKCFSLAIVRCTFSLTCIAREK